MGISPPSAPSQMNVPTVREWATWPTTTTPEVPKSPTTSTSSVLLTLVPPLSLTTKTVTPPMSPTPLAHLAVASLSKITKSPSHQEMVENYSTKSKSQLLHKFLM